MKALSILLILVFMSGCVRYATPPPPLPAEAPRWTFTTESEPKGTFLVVHGLNIRPSALDQICGFLAGLGYHSYRVTLRGHNQPVEETFPAAEWQRDVTTAYSLVRERFPTLPTYTLGYSIGGLLLTDMVDSQSPPERPKGMVLLAPAISLRPIVNISSSLAISPPAPWSIPNVAPAAYRRYELTPLFWYSNTLEIYGEMDHLRDAPGLKSVPTLLVLNPDDELVSEDGTRRWVSENHLAPEWRIALIYPDTSERYLKEHLIVDSQSLGVSGWEYLKAVIKDFLSRTKN